MFPSPQRRFLLLGLKHGEYAVIPLWRQKKKKKKKRTKFIVVPRLSPLFVVNLCAALGPLLTRHGVISLGACSVAAGSRPRFTPACRRDLAAPAPGPAALPLPLLVTSFIEVPERLCEFALQVLLIALSFAD